MTQKSKSSGKLLFFSISYTLFIIFLLWWAEQFIACGLGIGTGILRIVLFWISKEGEPFAAHAIQTAPQERTEQEAQLLQEDYQVYREEIRRSTVWGKPAKMLACLLFVIAVVYLDRQLIFYTYFMSLLVTWMWFQWWIAWRTGN
ncbi:MAG TPA: hypothetical protein PKL83_04255 [bacterium]|nr:hypothetical protein [bacterium]